MKKLILLTISAMVFAVGMGLAKAGMSGGCGIPPIAPIGCHYVCVCDDMGNNCQFVTICDM